MQEHDPAIFVVMDTELGGKRAKAIIDNLPMDRAIHTETIGYSSGLWLLWNSNKVEVESLAKTEQEFTLKSRYDLLTLLGFSLLSMLVLRMRKDAFYGRILPKLWSYTIYCGSWLGILMSL